MLQLEEIGHVKSIEKSLIQEYNLLGTPWKWKCFIPCLPLTKGNNILCSYGDPSERLWSLIRVIHQRVRKANSEKTLRWITPGKTPSKFQHLPGRKLLTKRMHYHYLPSFSIIGLFLMIGLQWFARGPVAGQMTVKVMVNDHGNKCGINYEDPMPMSGESSFWEGFLYVYAH